MHLTNNITCLLDTLASEDYSWSEKTPLDIQIPPPPHNTYDKFLTSSRGYIETRNPKLMV